MRARPFLAAAIVAGASACSSPFASDCISIGVFGVRAAVLDAQTGRPPTAATLTLTDGAYSETASLGSPPSTTESIYAAAEREGPYTATVTAPGYQPWTESGVAVRRGGSCDAIQPVRLVVRLARAP